MSKLQDFWDRLPLIIVGAATLVSVLTIVFLIFASPSSYTEMNFRAACAEAKGNTVWNGRHWECLK